jgi:hypothetical protein
MGLIDLSIAVLNISRPQTLAFVNVPRKDGLPISRGNTTGVFDQSLPFDLYPPVAKIAVTPSVGGLPLPQLRALLVSRSSSLGVDLFYEFLSLSTL